MSEWKEYKLGDVVQSISETYQFESGEKVVFLNTSDILDGHFLTDAKTEASTLPGQAKKRIRRGDILFSEIRPANRRFAMVNFDCDDYVVSTKLMVLRCKDKIDNRFLYLFLTSKDVLEYLQMVAEDRSGTFPQITFDIIANMDISLPPIEEQKRIAGVLSSLDDKIDLLNRENATLEALAETLFRHYFIENPDPRWKEGKVSDVSFHCKDSINPQKHSDKTFLHYSIPAYDNGQSPTEEQGQNIQSNKYVVSQNCILFSKLNPHKDKRVWLMLDDVQPNAICSTEFQIVKPQDDKWLYFLYGWLTYKENYDKIASGVSGTSSSHQRIEPNVIFDNDCPIVDDVNVTKYNAQVKSLFKKIKTNQQQILSLSAQRDTLLPRLMSGEIITSY